MRLTCSLVILSLLSLSLSTGCPVPTDEGAQQGGGQGGPGGGGPGGQGGGPGGQGGGPGGQGGGPGGQGGGMGGGMGGQGGGMGGQGGGMGGQGGSMGGGMGGSGGPGAATGGVLMVLDQMAPQQSQDEIKAAGNYVTISGSVTGTCTGNVRLDVIDASLAGAPPSPDGKIPGPVTIHTMESTGSFSIVVPKNKAINLTALCDNDKDGKISNSVDGLSLGAQLGELTSDQSGISLELNLLSATGIPGGGGQGGMGGQPGMGGPGGGGQGGQPGMGGPGGGGQGGQGGMGGQPPGQGGPGGQPGQGGPGGQPQPGAGGN